MYRSKKLLISCIILFLLSSTNITYAQNSSAEKLTTLLPDDTVAFIATSGGDETESAFNKSTIGQIWTDPDVQDFVQSIIQEIMPIFEQEVLADIPPDAVDAISNIVELVLSRPFIIGAAMKESSQEIPFYGFVILDAGDKKEALVSALSNLEALAGEGEIIDVRVGSTTLHSPADDHGVPGYWGWIGNYLVFAINDDNGEAIRYIQANNNRSVPDYLSSTSVDNDAMIVHIDYEKIFDFVSTMAEAEFQGGDQATALKTIIEFLTNNMQTITSRVGFEGQDIVINSLIEKPQSNTGLFSNFKTIDFDMFEMVDPDAVMAGAMNFDIAGMYDMMLELIETVAGEEFEDVLDEVESVLGFSIRNDFLESINGEMVFYNKSGAINIQQIAQGGFVIIARLDDTGLWQKSLDAIENFAIEESNGMVQISTQLQNGRTIHSWGVMPLAMMQLIPSWTIAEDFVVLASSPMLCDSAAQRIVLETQSISDTPDFKLATANLPENLISFQYNNSKVQFTQMMTALQQYWPMLTALVANQGLQLPFLLPNLTHISENINPSYQYSLFDDQGIRSYYRGSGIEAGIGVAGAVAGGAIGIGILMPALAQVRNNAQRTVSMSNLKTLTIAVNLYADDNEGRLPEDLEQLLPYYNNVNVLESPLKPTGFDGPCYILVEGYSNMYDIRTPSQRIIFYENPEYCEDTINTAFLDGHVEAMQRQQFLRALQETYEYLGRDMPEIKFGYEIATVIGRVSGQSNADLARPRMSIIESAIDTYLLNTGQYPKSLQDLLSCPQGLESSWAGPYLKPESLLDPWGNEYIYEPGETRSGTDYSLRSYGADGAPGGSGQNADIYNY